MRTMTNAADISRIMIRVKVQATDGGSWIDISDRLTEISESDSVEQDTNAVTLTFANAYSAFVDVTPNVNLDPNDQASTLNTVAAAYLPLLARNHAITVEVSKNSGVTWYEKFRGRVGPGAVAVDTDIEGDDRVICRPVGQEYAYKEKHYYDSIIYTEADVVSIMGQMFADHGFNQTVVEMDAPAFHVEHFAGAETNVWEAQKRLIEPTGFMYRMRYDSGSGLFKPTVYDPVRTNTTPDWTCTGLFNHRKMDLDESSVRSEIIVFYRQRNTGAILTASAADDAARLKYGIPDGYDGRLHKTMWYAAKGLGERHSMIDSPEEGHTLASYILWDLKEPAPDVEHSLPYVHPGIEVHDIVSFVGRDYTALVGVTGYSWSASRDDWIGKMTIQGTLNRVIGSQGNWLARDSANPDVKNENLLSHLQGDGARPPVPQTVTAYSYKGLDSSTGAEVPIVVLDCEEIKVWDLSAYVWEWWVVGENKITQETTIKPQLVIKGKVQVGKKVAAHVYTKDWSVTGG